MEPQMVAGGLVHEHRVTWPARDDVPTVWNLRTGGGTECKQGGEDCGAWAHVDFRTRLRRDSFPGYSRERNPSAAPRKARSFLSVKGRGPPLVAFCGCSSIPAPQPDHLP